MAKATAFVCAAVVLAAAFFVYSRVTRPPEVPAVRVVRTDVVATLAVSGQVEAVDRSEVSAQLSGMRVVRVLADIGTRVEAGQPLVELDAADLQASVQAARARVEQAQAQQAAAGAQSVSAQRQREIAEDALDEVVELRNARSNAATAVQVARARLSQAELNLNRTRDGARREAVAAAEANLRTALAQEGLARSEAARAERLYAQGAISQSDVEVARTARIAAEAATVAARENRNQLQVPRTEDVAIAESTVTEARSALAGAQETLQNAEMALQSRLAARSAMTSAEGQSAVARANLAAAQAEERAGLALLAQAEAQLAKAVIRAPFPGVVTERMVQPGQTVAPGVPLFRLAAPGRLRIRLDVDEASISRITMGQTAQVSADAFPGQGVTARVSDIGKAADFSQGTLEVRLQLDEQPAGWRPGLTVDANLELARYPRALVVPREAVLDPDGDSRVFLIQGGRVTARRVKVTPGDVGSMIVEQGLADGDMVATAPRSLREGQRVIVQVLR